MKIFVDADSCPVVEEVESVAKWHHVPVMLICDTNHVLTSDYSEIKVIGAGADAVDFVLVNLCQAGDVVVTQDYGVAAMALSRGAYAVNQNGWRYTDENIDALLNNRYSPRGGSLPHKRTREDDENFVECFDRLLEEATGKEDD
ncbi:MAG: DUF188 domain-containing protein [Selenomonadaceae bacterium]|nr:DUF188 domain-containing protein [Selenomonadaceae bacterium]